LVLIHAVFRKGIRDSFVYWFTTDAYESLEKDTQGTGNNKVGLLNNPEEKID
jgi:hypothetical protein